MKGWTPQAIEKASRPPSVPQVERTPVTTTKEPSPPPVQRSAQISAAIGLAGVQVWNGVDGQGSVLRFFELSPDDKQALLALAAERGIHPVRR